MGVEIDVRRGTREDMKDVLRLIAELALYEKCASEAVLTVEQLQEDGFDKNLFETFVAQIDGVTVGFALYYKRYSTWKGMTLYLEDLYISEDHRRKGVGFVLFDAVARRAKEVKATRLEWQVLDWNEIAINFYKSKLDAEMDSTWINCRFDEKRIQAWGS
eukprot:TRINITY_DN20611_c1_g1_i1.p1 TRINITY_DN20611_c1_g1~~TRINITY_DN20611_c1_g1_i1.p1  ORF type:complete len:172 (+),score=75.17 TRINITY_DN20611_c1_g1_i1:37-516(+)